MVEPSDEQTAAFQTALADSIQQAASGLPEMVVKWIAIVETIDDDGERGLWALAQPGLKRWDVLGMLADATIRAEEFQL